VSTTHRGLVIVGAALAGLRAAEAARRAGYSGALTLVGDEQHFPPFDRPTFSKEMITGDRTIEECRLRAGDLDARTLLGRVATRLDLVERAVEFSDATAVGFDRLIIATGTVPRLLPVGDSVSGVFVLRAMEDALRLRTAIRPGSRVVIVGAGFVGSEVAASARRLGAEVTVVEGRQRPLASTMGPVAGSIVKAVHERNGVSFRFGRLVTGITEVHRDGWPALGGVILDDGSELPADVLVVAIGVVPSTDWLMDSGLKLDDGVVCDQYCAAVGAEGVYAAGDVAKWFHPLFGRHLRVEHWTNALEQGTYVGRAVAAPSVARAYDAVPYFWSHQYEQNLQFLGLVGDREEAAEYDAEARYGVVTYYEGNRLVGALLVNCPQRLAEFRKAIREQSLAQHNA
jgi:NADPH-dependent 2,4-dienoyl-CoA reductase/sulfur reductase-like enzyme